MKIRPATRADHDRLTDIWLRSVRATHLFLSEDDVQYYLPLVRDQALQHLDVWVLERAPHGPVGFSGLDGNKVEALFLDPDHLRCGGGTLLMQHARQLQGPLQVDVNEQNPHALAFYQSLGFTVTSRSSHDDSGRPFPILHLTEEPMDTE